VRGTWGGLVTDADARWVFDRFTNSPERRDVKIARGTHLMHLEAMRTTLWRESPITKDEFKALKESCRFTDWDMVYLRLIYDVLMDQAEDLVTMWRGIIAQHTHLASYSRDRYSGKPDKEYGVAVGKRLARWALDTARAEYDQRWLDYQYEIGLRHHRAKKNVTDHAHTATRIGGRDVIGFDAPTVGPMHPYLEKGGHSADTVLRIQEAWWKSMILQVTLWPQPYMKPGDF
jgi:hypothetical protein